MKRLAQVVFITLALLGSFSSVTFADGPYPPPVCDPADPTCKVIPPGVR